MENPSAGRRERSRNYYFAHRHQLLLDSLTTLFGWGRRSQNKCQSQPRRSFELTLLISLVLLASVPDLWWKSCSNGLVVSFGIALHIGLLEDVASIASLSSRRLRFNSVSKFLGLLDRCWRMRVLFGARHQTRPAQQLQVGILFRFADVTGRRELSSTAGDRRARFLTTQRRKGEIIILRWILSAMIPLNLLQVLIKLGTWRCHRRCGKNDTRRSTN